ncbi:MAG: sensor histidine kinase [Fermentimonas sp.]|nr:sensor histidine kinase [Fermentimonas sp.]
MVLKVKYLLLLCFCVLSNYSVFTQDLDSIELLLQGNNEYLMKVNDRLKIYDDLSWGYLNSNFEKSKFYGEKGLKLSAEEGDSIYLATFKRNLGVAYYMESRFDIALEYLNEALEITQETGNEALEARIYNALGNLYNRQSDYTPAIDFYMKSLTLHEKNRDKSEVGKVSGNMGVIYQKLRNFEQALKYFEQAEKIAKELDNRSSLASIYVSLSDINIYIDTNKAIEYAEESIDIFRELGNRFQEVDATLALAKVYYSNEEYIKAENVAMGALKIAEELEAPFLISQSYVDLSNIYYHQNKYKLSEHAAQTALEYDSTDVNLTSNMLYNITRSNIHMGNAEKAVEYLDKLRDQLDIYSNSEFQSALSELEVKYETEKKELRIEVLEKEKRLIWLLTVAIVALLLFALAFFIVRHRLTLSKHKLAEQQLMQLEKEKQLATVQAVLDGETAERSRLAKDLHDGLGSMLSVVKYNLPEMKTGVILEKESVERFRKAVDMLDDSIQELRRVAHHMMPESLIRFGLKASLADFCDAIPNAQFHYYGNEVRLDSKLEILLYRSVHELVNNAIKHANAEKIDVQIIQESDRISLVVQDDGFGFDTEAKRDGMGLDNIRKRVESYDGVMFISSNIGKGTEIHIELDLENNPIDENISNE